MLSAEKDRKLSISQDGHEDRRLTLGPEKTDRGKKKTLSGCAPVLKSTLLCQENRACKTQRRASEF